MVEMELFRQKAMKMDQDIKALCGAGKRDEAIVLHRRALAIYEAQLAPGHEAFANVKQNLGSLYFARGEVDAGLRFLEEALAIQRNLHGPEHLQVGVVLHEMVTGANPFRRDNAIETLNAILKEEAPRIRSASAGAPEELERIVAKAMAKSPAARYGSARELECEGVRRGRDSSFALRPPQTVRNDRRISADASRRARYCSYR